MFKVNPVLVILLLTLRRQMPSGYDLFFHCGFIKTFKEKWKCPKIRHSLVKRGREKVFQFVSSMKWHKQVSKISKYYFASS